MSNHADTVVTAQAKIFRLQPENLPVDQNSLSLLFFIVNIILMFSFFIFDVQFFHPEIRLYFLIIKQKRSALALDTVIFQALHSTTVKTLRFTQTLSILPAVVVVVVLVLSSFGGA